MSDRVKFNSGLLDEIAAEILADAECPLRAGCTQPVPGEGSPTALVAFVGEAPGAEEDASGRPFVGRSGKLLRKTIEDVGMGPEDFWIGNVVKCRPPDNRDPLPSEIEHCKPYLFAQLVVIQPRVIVTLGRFALNCLIDPEMKISKVRGQHIRKQGQLYLPTYHPSAVLRSQGERLTEFRRDIAVAFKLASQPRN